MAKRCFLSVFVLTFNIILYVFFWGLFGIHSVVLVMSGQQYSLLKEYWFLFIFYLYIFTVLLNIAVVVIAFMLDTYNSALGLNAFSVRMSRYLCILICYCCYSYGCLLLLLSLFFFIFSFLRIYNK